jgi:hypothetical protein
VQREAFYTTVDPKDLGNSVPVDESTRHIAPAMRKHTLGGDQAPILTANSWDRFITIYPAPPPSYEDPTQYCSSPMILPFNCASNGLSGIPLTVSPAHSSTRSHESTLDSPLGQTQNGHHSCNDLLSSTLFQSGQIFSGPNFVPAPSISPGSHASTANPLGTNAQHTVVGDCLPAAFNPVELSGDFQFTSNGVAKFHPAPETSLPRSDRTISANDLLFMGPRWGGGGMYNPGVSEQKTHPRHILYDHPQRAPGVGHDILNVSKPPCEAGVPMPLPRMGMDSSSLYQTNSQYQHSSNSVPQGNNDPATSYFPGKLLDHFPISDAPNAALTTEEKEWILSIELAMRKSSPSQLASQSAYAGSSSVAAPTSFDRHNTGVPLPGIAYALEHKAGSSSTVDQHPRITSRILSEQRSPTSDLRIPPQSVPGQSMEQLSTAPGMLPLNMASFQPPFTTPSSVLNAAPSSQQPTPIVRRRNRKRHREFELDYNGALSDDAPISATCEWDGCGDHLASVGDFRKHFIKSGTEASKHNLSAGNNRKTQTICLWGSCQKPVACLWRHLWEVHGGFPTFGITL